MLKIFKYPIEIIDRQTVEMPILAVPLSAQMQDGKLCVWVKVDPLVDTFPVTFFVVGTGHKMTHDQAHALYLDTVVLENGLVWHIFYSRTV